MYQMLQEKKENDGENCYLWTKEEVGNMEYTGKQVIDGGTINWKHDLPAWISYYWNKMYFGSIDLSEGNFRAVPNDVKSMDAPVYATFEEAHDFMVSSLPRQKENLLEYAAAEKAFNEARKKERDEYNSKFHHLELEDVKADSDIYYTDLPSTRLMNIIKVMGATTLSDLAANTKSDFLKYRNCGKKVAEEVEAMFKVAGIWWDDPNSKKNELAKFSDQELIDECKRRGLKIN